MVDGHVKVFKFVLETGSNDPSRHVHLPWLALKRDETFPVLQCHLAGRLILLLVHRDVGASMLLALLTYRAYLMAQWATPPQHSEAATASLYIIDSLQIVRSISGGRAEAQITAVVSSFQRGHLRKVEFRHEWMCEISSTISIDFICFVVVDLV